MSAKLLEGKPVADHILEQVAARVSALRVQGHSPGLATVLVGSDPASVGYVQKKHEACRALGIYSKNVVLDRDISQEGLHEAIRDLNLDPEIHGFLIQHPLPAHLDFARALAEMNPKKDADGLHPTSIGRLAVGLRGPIPATPAAVRAIFVHYGIETEGKHVVVIGRGPTLGRPLSLLLSQRLRGANAAVTLVHSGLPNLAEHTLRADIVVSGVGSPGIVQPPMIREGAVVVSAGLSWLGKKLLPDVHEAVGERASWITPRLGGVGVCTVAMLLENTVALAERQIRE